MRDEVHGRRWYFPGLLIVVQVLVLAGCSGEPEQPGPPPLPPAAEPAAAPPLTTEPVGEVVPVGPLAEGIAADPVTHVVAVGVREPNSLALVDGRTGDQIRTVPLPGHLRHLQLAAPGGPVLVPAESSNSLLRVALPSGEKLSRVPTGVFPHDATAAANGALFVANEFDGTVAVVREGEVVHRFSDQTQPGGLAAVGNTVGLIDVRQNDLTVYDAETLRQTARLPAGAGPTHVVAAGGERLAVTDTRGDALLLYDLTPTPRQIGRVDLPGSPYGIAYDPAEDRVWVTLTERNEIVAIDPATTPPRVVDRLPTVRQPNTVAVDSETGRVFVTGTAKGVLQLIDP